MIISLNGKPGSGKSTIGTKLAAALGYERVYIGGMRRDMARRKGMTLQEFNQWSETHPEGDTEFDEYLTKLGKEKDNFIIESRTAFHFIPHSVKIFLDVTDEVGAERIWHALQTGDEESRNEAPHLDSYEAVLASVKDRLRSDKLRYEKYYLLDIFDPQHYDLFLDTSGLSIDEEFAKVKAFIESQAR